MRHAIRYATDYKPASHLTKKPVFDCGPVPDRETGRMRCPCGFDLTPHVCLLCSGEGCPFCHWTGQMSACKECRGSIRLLAELVDD